MSTGDGRAAAAYDAVAKEYATANETAPYNALYERPAVIELLGDVSGKRFLDVGCGAGPLAQWLVENGASVVGFDVSPAMVAIARERALPDTSFHVADLAEPLAFLPDAAFDVAVGSLVMHYLRDWVAPLRELKRVLAPGGTLLLSTHHPADDIELSVTGNYFDVELLHDRWGLGGKVFDVHFWRRPLTAMFSALTTKPAFVFFQLRADTERM
jgi:ubiquinone/menaquinone biosynthesis C-methylase UbiE